MTRRRCVVSVQRDQICVEGMTRPASRSQYYLSRERHLSELRQLPSITPSALDNHKSLRDA